MLMPRQSGGGLPSALSSRLLACASCSSTFFGRRGDGRVASRESHQAIRVFVAGREARQCHVDFKVKLGVLGRSKSGSATGPHRLIS